METIKKNRDRLFAEAKSQIIHSNSQKESILYHNIYSLKMNEDYLFSSKEEISDLVEFLNTCDL